MKRPECARTCLRAPRSCTARSCRSTTCSTSTPGRRLIREFELPAAAILKHNNPCGCAVADSLKDAYDRALACDPTSAFGGVVVFNRPIDKALAEKLNENFVELVFAPGYDEGALEILTDKPNVRIIEDAERRLGNIGERDMRRVVGGLLLQDRDNDLQERSTMEVAGKHKPTEQQWGDMLFALEGLQARPLERDRAGQGPRHDRDRRRADEPRRLGADRDREGRRRGHLRWRARRSRRTPSSRSPTARSGDQGGRASDHPARRLEARRRGDRGLRQGRRRHDLHRPPPLPALKRADFCLAAKVGSSEGQASLSRRAPVAQGSELRTFNPGVVGSNPTGRMPRKPRPGGVFL